VITTVAVNLVPAPRRIERRRRGRVRLWFTLVSVYGVILLGLFAVFQTLTGTAVQSVDDQLALVNAEITLTGDQVKAIAPQLLEMELTLEASLAVGHQPDWSVLLALLASRLNDRVVLSHCGLTPVKGEVVKAAAVRPGQRPRKPVVKGLAQETPAAVVGFKLDLRGMAKTQASLSAFVLRLERTQLFGQVVLGDALRVQFVKDDAVQFRIECTLKGGDAKR